MPGLYWAIGSSIAVSLISLVGILTFLFKESRLNKLIVSLIGFSAGALIAGAFMHLLPEALETTENRMVFSFVIVGFVSFFIMEKYFYWRHCHNGVCDVHAFTYLNLVGDGIHNFVDGLVIGASFIVDVHFGLVTTLVIILHEIPQEMGDFGVLVYGGFSRKKALYFNFVIALTCVAGAIIGYLSSSDSHFSAFLLPFTAGGFIYIASCDLVPELHKQPDGKKSAYSLLAFIGGILFVTLSRLIHAH